MRGDQINLQNIIARSATTEPSPQIRSGGVEKVTKLIDVSVCIGCKACQVACMEWNDLRDEVGECDGTYNAPQDLTPSSFEVMRFSEYENEEGGLEWLIRKDNCMHCAEPGCLKACPSPGAIVQYANGIVDFNSEHCIGCGYCVAGCPFDIPRISKKDNKAYKCTLCSDRVYHGLEPACVKSCPTGAIQFGTKDQMLDYGAHRVGKLNERGYERRHLRPGGCRRHPRDLCAAARRQAGDLQRLAEGSAYQPDGGTVEGRDQADHVRGAGRVRTRRLLPLHDQGAEGGTGGRPRGGKSRGGP